MMRALFNGRAGAHRVSSTMKFDGKWLKADCGDVKPIMQPK